MLKIGSLFAERYSILAHIGSGGMADVYKASDTTTNDLVAIKILKAELSEDREFVSRFEVEGQAMASLHNNNVVRVFDVGRYRTTYYIIMEYVDGITLKDYIRRKGQLSPRETMAIASQAAVGLRAIHARHIVHRDMKPQNIILSREGSVKITDFGIAHDKQADKPSFQMRNAIGSVHYIAPEQAKGAKCDERSDLYSLGVCMYEMITGRVPFDKDTTVAVALAHMNENMVPPTKLNPACPIALEQIIFRCTQKSRDRRYHNVTELLGDLKIAVNNPRHDFEKHEEETLMRGDTQVFSDDEVEVIRGDKPLPEKRNMTVKPGNIQAVKRTPKQMPKTAEKANEEDENVSISGTFFDKFIIVLGIVIGAASLCMGIYIVASLSGWIQTSSIQPSNVITTTAYDPMDDITVQTKASDEYDSSNDAIVPNVIGLSVQEAISALQEEGLEYQISSLVVYSDEYKVGEVCKQSYKGNTIVPKGSTIVIAISAGTDKFEIKDTYVGRSLLNFKNDVEEFKDQFTIIYKSEYNDDYGPNVIVSIDPSSGIVKEGDKITVTYSLGSEYAPMPNLIGLDEETAKIKLEDLGLVLGSTSEQYSDTVKKGLVLYQQYEKGKSLKNGTIVSIILSKGAKEAELPDVTGLTEVKAIEALEKAGFTNYTIVKYYEDIESTTPVDPTKETVIPAHDPFTRNDYGKVVYMLPEAAEEVKQSEAITLYVLTKPEVLINVVGMTESNAEKALSVINVTPVFIYPASYTAADVLVVTKMDKEPGTEISTDNFSVRLTLAVGVPMVDLTGMTKAQAKNAVEALGCNAEFSVPSGVTDSDSLLVDFFEPDVQGYVAKNGTVKITLKSNGQTPPESSETTEAPTETSSEAV